MRRNGTVRQRNDPLLVKFLCDGHTLQGHLKLREQATLVWLWLILNVYSREHLNLISNVLENKRSRLNHNQTKVCDRILRSIRPIFDSFFIISYSFLSFACSFSSLKPILPLVFFTFSNQSYPPPHPTLFFKPSYLAPFFLQSTS